MIEPIQALGDAHAFIAPAQALTGLATSAPGGQAHAIGSFGEMVGNGLTQMNGQLLGVQTDLQSLATGNAENLHQIMIRLEEARINFQLAVQVRNKVLEAYQDVMKMQV